jgi:CheY-like chemotaxis protein
MAMSGEPVLIVDDDAVNLKLARVVLEEEGYAVRTASDADEAFHVLRTFFPKVVLVDIKLPGIDGLELTRRLKSDAATSDIVILAVSASAMQGDDEKARAAGCDGYVTKPIDIEALLKTIASHIRSRGERA